MNSVEIIVNNNKTTVNGLYYVSHNNYYFIYTTDEIDANGFVVLYVVKVLQEVINTEAGPKPTGYLIGTTIVNDEEYDLVKQDIANIIEDKQQKKETAVMYLNMSMLTNLKIKDAKIFRLKKSVFDKTFKDSVISAFNKENTSLDDYKTKYENLLMKNEELERNLEKLNNQINQIKNIIGE